ncbi:MAG: GDSL-type esterase/lipase family protein [Victivallaceae bacterium]|jgi:lysophospholipase L1-like esterase
MLTFDTPWLEKGEKLVCFGDSLTAAQDGYVKILESKLRKLKIKVINAGLGGDKTPAALARLRADVIALKPDAVSVFLGANDAAVGRGIWADEPRVEPEAYKSNLIWIIHLCRLSGIRKFSIATPAWQFEGAALANCGGVMPVYCIAAREAADESGSRLVPLDAVFAQEWLTRGSSAKSGMLLTRDGTHMTPAGNELIAATMLSAWKLA